MSPCVMDSSNDAQSRVYKEFGMTSRGVAQDVASLKSWLVKQPHLPYIKGDKLDQWLENYLITCKNSVERAKESLDMYFTVKVILPDGFTMRDPAQLEFQKSFRAMGLSVLPKLTPAGRRVLLFSHLTDVTDDFNPTFMIKRLTMMFDIVVREGVDYIGIDIIVDSKNVCLGHLAKYNITSLRKTIEYGMKAYPQRINTIHVVNPFSMVEMGLALFKPLVGKKLQDRFVVHRNMKDLQKTIPADVLPKDFGGEAASISELNDSWQQKLMEYREWFLANDDVKSDESKRVGKSRYSSPAAETTFGNSGTFRKIEVD